MGLIQHLRFYINMIDIKENRLQYEHQKKALQD